MKIREEVFTSICEYADRWRELWGQVWDLTVTRWHDIATDQALVNFTFGQYGGNQVQFDVRVADLNEKYRQRTLITYLDEKFGEAMVMAVEFEEEDNEDATKETD